MLLTASLKKPTVLVFCRDYLIPDFREMLRPIANDYDIRLLTDGTWGSENSTRARFYRRLGKAGPVTGWPAEDEEEVIGRCRVLRNMPRARALAMARAMASVFNEELDLHRPIFVFAQMVDEYVTHVLAEMARLRGLRYVSICSSYFSGCMLITQHWRGEPYRLRHPIASEVESALTQISETSFRQNYRHPVVYNRMVHARYMAKYFAKRIVFPVQALLKRDPLNIHYACLPYLVERRRWSDFPADSKFHQDWRDRIRRVKSASTQPLIYFPLGYYPESTINYWIRERSVLEYEAFILNVCRRLSVDFHVVVKDHFHMMGARNVKLYEELNAIPGVTNVPPNAFSNEIVSLSDLVLVGGGSVGVESYVRDKPVATYCDTSYWFAASGATYFDVSKPDSWCENLRDAIKSFRGSDDVEKRAFVASCMESTGRISKPGKVWPILSVEDLSALFAKCSRP